ncbi:S1 RNA-binding domain-containing protein [Actinokineospora spheciospongiae]|nr:S1 RNA-binding domain-containing protein [Actinokineospora spheciospongiae]
MRMFPQVDETFTGTVVDVAPFGSFVEHPDGTHGLLHGETVEVGTTLDVRVLHSDPVKQRYSLARA